MATKKANLTRVRPGEGDERYVGVVAFRSAKCTCVTPREVPELGRTNNFARIVRSERGGLSGWINSSAFCLAEEVTSLASLSRAVGVCIPGMTGNSSNIEIRGVAPLLQSYLSRGFALVLRGAKVCASNQDLPASVS
ncbi:hypothetical protein K0M31_017508 [Melipona bicolor]|uniref:Uncharacterized protein n=1 Tax=Melipona bicolor TaxID=60889 RepID=A0AA40KSI3_9HYME|nr:hypothetical protein K0M31_017508 [Melipona bicolor]